MAFFESHFFSDALALSVSAHVILPQQTHRQIGMTGSKAAGPLPTLYLLHGLSDDHSIWMRRTSIERYAAERGIAVVMPAVARSFYHDMASGPKYWTYLSEELPQLMQQFFPLSARREDNFAAGLSMGGYGAARLALGRPNHFAAAASLSGVLDLQAFAPATADESARISRAEWEGIFGSPPELNKTPTDVFLAAEQVAKGIGPRPELFISCGTEDELLPHSRKFASHLKALGYSHTSEELPGIHDWIYWDAAIQRVLDWLPITQA
jgi:putative tributyrin esterase